MLSAFTARPIVELKPRDKFKIESILAFGDRLLVGLSTGSLKIYRVNEVPEENGTTPNGSAKPDDKPSSRPSSSATSRPVDLLRELEKFSTRAVEQLARIKEANILISLSNSYVSIHDLGTYELQEQLTKTKNATTFAVTSNIVKDSATGIPEIISRLAVAVKRRLLLWSWHDSEQSLETVEIALPEAIKSLTWVSATKIICGMNSGYVIADVVSEEVEDIVGPGAFGGASGAQGGRFGGVGSASMGYMGLGGYVPKPLATKLAEGEMLLAKDINSLFITSEGKPMDKRQIPWQQAPDAIGYSYPYILALQPPSQGTLDVRNPETLSLLQSIPLPNAKQLHFPPPSVSLAHAAKGFHVMSERCIWRMGATDYDTQVDELVEKGRYDEALSVLDMLEDALLKNKTDRVREIKIQKAQMLFDQRKYRAAVDIFMGNEGKGGQNENVQAPPERVIRLYPRVIAGDLSTVKDEAQDAESDGDDHQGSTNGDPAEPPVGSPKPAAISKLLKTQQKAASDTSSIRSFMKLDAGESNESKPVDDKPLEGKDLVTAALELNQYLVQARNEMKQYLDPETGKLITSKYGEQNGSFRSSFKSLLVMPLPEDDHELEEKLHETAKLIDTTLFRSYMLVRPQLAGPLFRIANFCDPDVVNEKLLESSRYNDLVDFFHGKKLHRPALELLQKFGKATADKDKDQDESSTAAAAAAPTLHGPQRTIGYLQNLPPEMIDLILEFAEWPLRADPAAAMEIFTGDTENAETLPRDKVLNFLQAIDVELAVQYLEHMVNELNDAEPDFHNRLVSAYLQDLKARDEKRREKGKDQDKDKEKEKEKEKEKGKEQDEVQDEKAWKLILERLLAFLRSSGQYSPTRAFEQIPKDDPRFYEAQAIVLSNMGLHKQALNIYVFKLQDFEKAEEYCNRVHLAAESALSSSPAVKATQPKRTPALDPDDDDDKQVPSIYHTLLSLYLQPPPPNQPNWPPALDLLSKHGSRLPASSTLNLIPATLPVAELESYFRGRIRAANSVVNESRIVTGLRKSELRSVQADLLLGGDAPELKAGRNRRVVVPEERVCGVCHKRMGRSVIAVLPDNEVVHYGCVKRAGGRVGAAGNGVAGAGAGAGPGGMESLRTTSWRV